MLTRMELQELERSMRGARALSIYLTDAATDPAERAVWRQRLSQALQEARDALRGAGHAERAAFERAVARLEERLAALPGGRPFGGFVAFATPDAIRHAAVLRARVPLRVAWGDGIRVAPYLRALAPRRRTALAVVDSRSARLFTYADGTLDEHGTMHARGEVGPVSHMGDPPRATFHTGTRGATGTDAAERARVQARDAMLRALADRLIEVAGPDGWIAVGGIPTVATAAVGRLADDGRRGARVLAGLDVHATAAQVAARADAVANELQEEADAATVAEMLDRFAAGGTASAGRHGTLAALREGAVDRLCFTERFLQDEPDAAELAVHAALDQDAEVACVTGAAAARLDAEGRGIAARLRFVAARGRSPLAASAS